MMPFAVVGSERNVIVDGKPVRGRKNRWGVVNVENEAHCDFNYLRNFLTRCALARSSSPLLVGRRQRLTGLLVRPRAARTCKT